MHPAFAKFKSVIAQPLPFKHHAAQAKASAWNLCMTMPNHFEDKDSRNKVVFRALQELFVGRVFIQTGLGSAKVDGALLQLDGSPEIIVQTNNEPGAGEDVYMHCAASFNAAAIHQIEQRGRTECVAFMIAVDGELDTVLNSNTYRNK
jgi:hypothetical protein